MCCMDCRWDVMRGCGDWIVGISAGHAKMLRPIPANLNMPRATKVD